MGDGESKGEVQQEPAAAEHATLGLPVQGPRPLTETRTAPAAAQTGGAQAHYVSPLLQATRLPKCARFNSALDARRGGWSNPSLRRLSPTGREMRCPTIQNDRQRREKLFFLVSWVIALPVLIYLSNSGPPDAAPGGRLSGRPGVERTVRGTPRRHAFDLTALRRSADAEIEQLLNESRYRRQRGRRRRRRRRRRHEG